PFFTMQWAKNRDARMRRGILLGFFAAAAGYMLLSRAPSIALACAAVVFTHAAGSTIWVFSSTLLQSSTDDRFRGRVFAAELGLNMLAISVASYAAGRLVDSGATVRTAAFTTGVSLLVPGCAWGLAQRLWRAPAGAGRLGIG
ncbi:MAG: hypothetical protein HY013_09625, partial [Candidatus Solibacter usitatus]|nr:hypothetical protein [Candidatus Solibacter usitatus]